MITLVEARAMAERNEPLPEDFYLDPEGEVQVKPGRSVWTGKKLEDWRIDWSTYGGPYIRYPAWPHPENGHDIAKLCFADPCPFEEKRKRAYLIAAAPDLFDALERVMATRGKPMPEEYVDGGASYRLALAAWEDAQAALRKVRNGF